MRDDNPANDFATGNPQGLTTGEVQDRITSILSDFDGVEFDVEFMKGGDFVVTIYHGEYPEGAPIPAHAIYSSVGDPEEVETWAERVREIMNEGYELDAALEEFRDEYNRALAAGLGDWLRGSMRLAASRAQAKVDVELVEAGAKASQQHLEEMSRKLQEIADMSRKLQEVAGLAAQSARALDQWFQEEGDKK